MGKGKSKKAAAPACADMTEDDLLDQTIANNKKAAGVRPLTKTELIAKLDQVMFLNVVATQDGNKPQDGNKQIIPGCNGELCWFSDVFDAKSELAAMLTQMPPPPGISLGLDFCPLGRAFSLSDGWVSAQRIQGESPPMRLQPASKVLETCGADGLHALEQQLPAVLKQHNRRQGAFPLFYLKELQNERVLPYFFTREDLVTSWMSSGKAVEDLPPTLDVTDLRALVARVLTEPNDWHKRLLFVPPQCVVDLMQMLDGVSDQLEALGSLAAKATGEVVAEDKAARAATVASGEEPPPLE